jgi:hypothetical protein
MAFPPDNANDASYSNFNKSEALRQEALDLIAAGDVDGGLELEERAKALDTNGSADDASGSSPQNSKSGKPISEQAEPEPLPTSRSWRSFFVVWGNSKRRCTLAVPKPDPASYAR